MLIFSLLLFVYTTNAQFAVVSSDDGYANVRVAPSTIAKISTPLQNNIVVLMDAIYADDNRGTDWVRVYFGQGPYCFDCTPDMAQHASGYIHKSQLKVMEALEPVADTVFNMVYTIESFDPSDKKIIYYEGSSAIESINGRAFFGADCGTPKTEIVKAVAFLKGLKDTYFYISMDFLSSVLHADNNFTYYRNDDSYFAVQQVGEGTCATDLVWVFEPRGLKQRLMGRRL